jgi:hypothetical protein
MGGGGKDNLRTRRGFRDAGKSRRASRLRAGHSPAGQSYAFYLQLQLNPTDLGRRSENVELADGTQRIVRIERTATVFP